MISDKIFSRSSILFPILLIVLFICISSCEQGPGNTDELRTVCFDTEVLPLLVQSCATTECHDAAAEGGLQLDSYEGIMKGVVPGNAFESNIYYSIISSGQDHMPPDSLLPVEKRTLIRVWIEQGAEQIICTEPVDTGYIPIEPPFPKAEVCFERDILPVMQSSCGITGCHDPINMQEDFNFTNYQGILDGVVPGNPLISKIYEVITEDEPSDVMPPLPYSPLSKAQIDSIYNWIAGGALDEDCISQCDTVDVTYMNQLEALLSNYCTGCHGPTNPRAGVRLDSYTNLMEAISSGAFPAVLRASSGYAQMPPNGAMSECDIRKFELWIEDGMPN